MSITKINYGKVDNQDVYLYTLTNSTGMSVKVMNLGCHIMQINVPDRTGKMADVVLSFDSFEAAVNQSSCFGVVVGRCANRIEKSFFKLNGKRYDLYANNGLNHLHGGKSGFDRKVWNAQIISAKNMIKFQYLSCDGEENYPGNLQAEVYYSLTDDNSFTIEYKAVSDADTLVNLTNHSYFNLEGHNSGSILDHYLKLNCNKYTESNSELIPTGVIADVEGTPFDFREFSRIGDRIDAENEQLSYGQGYDHNFAINQNDRSMAFAASLWDKKSGRIMDVYTDKPGIQFYTGNFLNGSVVGKDGCAYVRRGGVCLETQFFPNAIKLKNFASPILKAGETYQYTTVYRFLTDF